MTTPAAPAPAAPPAQGGRRTLLIVFAVLGGLLLLVGGCAVGCTWYVGRKAKSYADSVQKNPQVAALALAAAVHPNLEVVDKDEAAGRITLRNKTTGKTARIDFAQMTPERAQALAEQLADVTASGRAAPAASAANDEGAPPPAPTDVAPAASEPAEPEVSPAKAAAMALTLKKYPAALPVYPGGRTQDAAHTVFGGNQLGTYVFTTKDDAARVVAFYEQRAGAEGYAVVSNNTGGNDYGATAVLALVRPEPRGSITVAAEPVEGGFVRVVATFTVVAP